MLQQARKSQIWFEYFPKSITKIDKAVLEILALGGKQTLYQIGKEIEQRGHSRSSAVYSLGRLSKLGLVRVYHQEKSKKFYGLTPLGFYVYIIVCDKSFRDIYYDLDLISENYPDLFPIFSYWKSSLFLKDYAKQKLINVACKLATRGFLLSAAIQPGDLRIPDEVNRKLRKNFWAYFFTPSSERRADYTIEIVGIMPRLVVEDPPLVSVFDGLKRELELHFSLISHQLKVMANVFLNIPYHKRLKLRHALTLLKLKIFYWISRVLLTLL